MRKRKIHRDNNVIKNVDFDKLNEILKEKGITKAELSRKCGYYDEYISYHTFGEKRLTKTVADTLEKVYGVSPDEYTYKEAEENTSNDGQLALRLDKDLIAKFKNWAYYNQLPQKYAMEKILSEYLDGKKTTTTASNDDTTEETISNDDATETTASNDDIYKYTFSFNGEFLQRLALASINEHMSIDDFVHKCLIGGIGDKILNV
jgi:transcriptional regulator with XRE-family HTH domain